MKKTMKKLLAMLLALSMCLSLCAPAWAAEESAEDGSVTAQSAEGISVEEVPAGEVPAAEPSEEETSAEQPSPGDKADEESPAQEDMSDKEEAPAENDAPEEETPDAAPAEAAPEEAPEETPVVEGTALETQDEDPYAAARYISTNSTVTDALEDSGIERYYRFSLSQDGAVSISFSHEYIDNSDPLWRVYLYNQNRELIQMSEFKGTEVNGTSVNYGLSSGSYYLRVTDGYYSRRWSSAPYSLKVNYSTKNLWEREFNNAFYYANQIAVNQDIYGTVMSTSDYDYYKFQLDADGVVSLEFTHPYIDNSDNLWRAYLYNSEEQEIHCSYFAGNTADTTKTIEFGLAAGTYYLLIRDDYYSRHWSDATYHFNVKYTASDAWEREFNHSFYYASPMAVNQDTYGCIMSTSDYDYYKFQLDADGVVSLEFTHPYIDNSDNLWRAYLYNSEEQEIHCSYFAGDTADTVKTIEFGLAAGTYYLLIRDDYYSRHWSDATYQINVNYTKSKYWESEFNNSFHDADPIERGKTYSGTIMNDDDVDYYKITLKKTSTIGYSFQHPFIDSSDNYWETGLYDADGNYIIGYYQKGNTSKKLKGAGKTLKAGTYYLKVTKSNRHSTQPYKISIIHRHSYTKKITKKPTLAAKGTAKYTCKECGDTYTKSVAKLKPSPVSSFSAERVYYGYGSTKHEIKFTWKQNKKADGYVIQACQNSDFSGRKSLQIKGGKNTSGTLKLKSSGYYYVRMKAYQKYKGKVYYSDWKYGSNSVYA